MAEKQEIEDVDKKIQAVLESTKRMQEECEKLEKANQAYKNELLKLYTSNYETKQNIEKSKSVIYRQEIVSTKMKDEFSNLQKNTIKILMDNMTEDKS